MNLRVGDLDAAGLLRVVAVLAEPLRRGVELGQLLGVVRPLHPDADLAQLGQRLGRDDAGDPPELRVHLLERLGRLLLVLEHPAVDQDGEALDRAFRKGGSRVGRRPRWPVSVSPGRLAGRTWKPERRESSSDIPPHEVLMELRSIILCPFLQRCYGTPPGWHRDGRCRKQADPPGRGPRALEPSSPS